MHKLIFLPGASGSRNFWHPLCNQLSVYTDQKIIEYPGFDGVKSCKNIQSFADFQQYIYEQIDTDSVLIAQSMGGVLALSAALHQPNKIKALILLATSGGLDLSSMNCEDWRQAYALQYPHVPDWFVAYQSYFTTQQLGSIDLPVLLLWGDRDPLSSVQVGEFLQQHLPNAQLSIITGGEHFFAATHADETAQYIHDFLSQQV